MNLVNMKKGMLYGLWQCTFGYWVFVAWHYLATGILWLP